MSTEYADIIEHDTIEFSDIIPAFISNTVGQDILKTFLKTHPSNFVNIDNLIPEKEKNLIEN